MIKNCVVDTSYRPKAYAFIEKQVEAGRQAYVICPMVEASEMIEGKMFWIILKHCGMRFLSPLM